MTFLDFLFHFSVGGGALWMLFMVMMTTTENLRSTFLFKMLPFLLGSGAAIVWLKHMGTFS